MLTPERCLSLMEDSLKSELARLQVCPMDNEQYRRELIHELAALVGNMTHRVKLELYLETRSGT